MNAPSHSTEIEPRWRTYSKAAAFTLPALIIWVFSLVFLLPKLQAVWNQAGFAAPPTALTAMNFSRYVQHNFFILVVAMGAVLVVVEWRSRSWPRYRAKLAWVTAFLVNTVVLVFLSAMFTTAVISAEAFLNAK